MERKEGSISNYQHIDNLDQETLDMLEEHSTDNPELVKDIFDSFAPEAQELIEKINEALSTDDYQSLRIHAHSLSGISGSIGAMRLKQIAADIETAVKSNQNEHARHIANFINGAYLDLTRVLGSL
jgi:HPt (histidine-containing phosphotransfer) domain-containing protein